MKWSVFVLMASALLCSCSSGRYAANTVYPAPDPGCLPEGHLVEVFYKPSVKGPEEKRMLAYLPKGYYGSDERYPVLYLLHGARGNETSWIDNGHLLQNVDSLTRCGAMKKTIIILPNMNAYSDDRDFGKSRRKRPAESVYGMDGKVESSFMNDVVATADSLFRTIPDKKHRAIAGLSAGAVQAIYISAGFPDAFDYVGAFSPFVKRTVCSKGEYGFYKGLKKKLEVQFSTPPVQYWIMIGKNDLFYPRIQEFISYLKRKGYDIRYFPTPGRHLWKNWEEYSRLFMQVLWKSNGCPLWDSH